MFPLFNDRAKKRSSCRDYFGLKIGEYKELIAELRNLFRTRGMLKLFNPQWQGFQTLATLLSWDIAVRPDISAGPEDPFDSIRNGAPADPRDEVEDLVELAEIVVGP